MIRIHTRKRRSPVIPIVSLIDILAILLIFFIVTTTFKERKNLLPIDVPTTERLEATASSESRTTLTVNADGEFFLDLAPVPENDLESVLSGLKTAEPDAKLELRADEAVPLKTLVALWDALTAAGFPIKEVPARIQTSESTSPSSPPSP